MYNYQRAIRLKTSENILFDQ